MNNITSDIAAAFHLHDFYSAHIMTYCEGFYTPNTTSPAASENVTYCSNRAALFHFDPQAIIESELAPGITLSDIQWPSGIEDGLRAVAAASKAMFVFYVIAIILVGLAFLAAVWGVFAAGRLSLFVNFALDILAFLSVGIASAIATAVIVKAVDAINHYGADIGLAAYKGSKFLGMTWAATGLMLLASIMWVAECCTGRRRGRGGLGEKGGH